MKKALIKTALSSVLTLVFYLIFLFIWGTVANFFENEALKLLLVALMTQTAFGIVLLGLVKIKGKQGEAEVREDYKSSPYKSGFEDLKLILSREKPILLAIGITVFAVCCMHSLDKYVFGKKVLSAIALPFAPTVLLSEVITVPILGYFVSFILDSLVYLAALLIYRKKKFNYWYNNEK